MGQSELLKEQLTAAAQRYANERKIGVKCRDSAVIFDDIADSFCQQSYAEILRYPDWSARTKKRHTQVDGAYEMQSSNSSDALLMNIFCHPKLAIWRGIHNVLGFVPNAPSFGIKARITKQGVDGDETEIDLAVGNSFAEAKLTEADFTDKPKSEVEKYDSFGVVFHKDSLEQSGDSYRNYQVIRNILAAVQHDKDHFLLCDERRPDLVRAYMQTVACVREIGIRRRCSVIFWQEIYRNAGEGLREFLECKYGFC